MKKWRFVCFNDWNSLFIIPTVIFNKHIWYRIDEPSGIEIHFLGFHMRWVQEPYREERN